MSKGFRGLPCLPVEFRITRILTDYISLKGSRACFGCCVGPSLGTALPCHAPPCWLPDRLVCRWWAWGAPMGRMEFVFGAMERPSDKQSEAPKRGASSVAWHSCQIKPCEWVCGESLCEVKIACFCNKSWVLLPLLTLLDSPMVEWEITWFIVCNWREK